MNEKPRGLFLLDPPAGGLERLRQAMRQDDGDAGWLPALPWATTALLLAFLVGVLRWDGGQAHRIVDAVREQEPTAWTALPDEQEEVRFYLAWPSEVEPAPDQP